MRVTHPAHRSAKRRGERGERRERSAQGMHQNSRTRTLHTQIPSCTSKPHPGPHQDLAAPTPPTQQQRSMLTEQRGAPEAQHSRTGAGREPGHVLVRCGSDWGSPQREPRALRASPHRARPQTTRRARSGRMGARRKRDAQTGSWGTRRKVGTSMALRRSGLKNWSWMRGV